MNVTAFYRELFRSLESGTGVVNKDTISAVIGFDGGGPLNFCKLGSVDSDGFISYVSCELALRNEQIPASCGRYEILTTANNEEWVRSVLTDIGRMTLEVGFDDGHTLDITSWTGKDVSIRGIVFEVYTTTSISSITYGVMRCHGVTIDELEYARQSGSSNLLKKLKERGIYPKTDINRTSIL